MGTCLVCNRLHTRDQPCPRRIANAFTNQPKALESLTDADKVWVKDHPGFNVIDVLEEAIAEILKKENSPN